MGKMIRVESCGGCDHKNRSRVDYYCDHPESYNIKFAAVIIPDQSKILPNCPLEDYPELRIIKFDSSTMQKSKGAK